MKAKGLKQTEVARRLGVTRAGVHKWLTTVKNLTLENIIRLAELLDVEVKWLALGEGPRKGKGVLLAEGTVVERNEVQMIAYYLTAEEHELLQTYRELEPGNQKEVLNHAQYKRDGQPAPGPNVVQIRRPSSKAK